MSLRRHIAPILSIGVLVLLAALPLGLSPDDRFVLPLLPVIAIHYWALRHDTLISEWMVFAAGLVLDILTHGPLGYWSLIYLATYLLAIFSQPFAGQGPLARLATLLVAVIVVSVMAWVVASAYTLELADWRPLARGAIYAMLAIVVLLPALRWLDGPRAERTNPKLARGV